MIPAPFEYRAPVSEEELIALLAKYGESARILAGGQSLVPALRSRAARPEVVVDLRRVAGLHAVEPADDGGLRIGAMATHGEIETSPLVAARSPLLRAVSALVGDALVRNAGTLVGSVCQADPAADEPAALAALDATVEVAGPGGTRIVKAADFLQGPFETALEPEEYVRAVRVPPAGGESAYRREPLGRLGWALAGAACRIALEDGRVKEARVAVTGVAPRVYRAFALEEALLGHEAVALARSLRAGELAGEVVRGQEILGDARASAEYRRHLAALLARRAILKALGAAGGGRVP